MIYQVHYMCDGMGGTTFVRADSRREARRLVEARLGPCAVAVVTGMRTP